MGEEVGGTFLGTGTLVLALQPLAAGDKGTRMSEQPTADLARCLLDYGQAIAHRAAVEAATLLDGQRPYPPYEADVLLGRATRALAAALREA